MSVPRIIWAWALSFVPEGREEKKMIRLIDVVIEREYFWTGTDGYGGRLDEPQVVTAVGMNPEGFPYPVIIETECGIRWEVSPSTLSERREGR